MRVHSAPDSPALGKPQRRPGTVGGQTDPATNPASRGNDIDLLSHHLLRKQRLNRALPKHRKHRPNRPARISGDFPGGKT